MSKVPEVAGKPKTAPKRASIRSPRVSTRLRKSVRVVGGVVVGRTVSGIVFLAIIRVRIRFLVSPARNDTDRFLKRVVARFEVVYGIRVETADDYPIVLAVGMDVVVATETERDVARKEE